MACPGITDILVRESGRFGTDIYKRAFPSSSIIGTMPRGTFPAGMGEEISVLTYERSAPDDTDDNWSSVAVVDGQEGGACLPPADELEIGSTTRTYGLKRRALRGPDFCAEEARSVFALREQLDSIAGILAEHTRLEWEKRNRMEYFRMCQHKVVCNTAMNSTSTSATTYPAYEPTSILTQGILNRWRMKLIRDGAGQYADGMDNGSPTLTLRCSAETSEHIIFADTNTRDDLRWGQPSELLKAYGVGRSYRGFYHIHDPFPRRFTSDGSGVFTEVPAFLRGAKTKGYGYDVNPAWEAASWEESVIYSRGVMIQLIPEPIVAPHPNFKFDPVSYTGDWKLLNILDKTCNPRGQIVFHHGILAAGSKPVRPELGVAFIHKRCDGPLGLITTCS